MFVRTKTRKGSPKRAIQIVDNVRVGDRVKQRIIRHLGMAETDAEEKALRAFGDCVMDRMKGSPVPIFPPEDLADEIRHARWRPPEDWRVGVLTS